MSKKLVEKNIVIDTFIDSDDERVQYPIGSLYPREGYEPTPERVAQLRSGNNAKGVALIKKLIELPPKKVELTEESPLYPKEAETVELDRTAIKAELDSLGISYAKNAKTEILAELLKAQKGE
ncbi:hypothetical protein ACVRY7_07810 [Streptococcus ictaluri]|uniref:HeH/LEM domain-containing protein n=1 Tax=Streptococcus ictaluri 707-05 TaxID=764299 RepID=G5K3R6_9STRE|nr:hypothetical protein [Streptococcus ictaluri]EHI69789.1 hypothetical protein STRIC_1437 [Streptococcus ictaluri 707-05]QBX25534.1 hypothetical protein Javan262_0019 [Streptococcus phage Javan262]